MVDLVTSVAPTRHELEVASLQPTADNPNPPFNAILDLELLDGADLVIRRVYGGYTIELGEAFERCDLDELEALRDAIDRHVKALGAKQ